MNWLPPCSSPELMKPCSASFGPFVVISQYVLDAHNQNLFCRLVQSSEKNKGPSHTSSAPSWRDISSVNVDPDRVAAGPGQNPALACCWAQRSDVDPPSAPQDSTGSRVNLHGHFHCLPYCSISTCPRLDC